MRPFIFPGVFLPSQHLCVNGINKSGFHFLKPAGYQMGDGEDSKVTVPSVYQVLLWKLFGQIIGFNL